MKKTKNMRNSIGGLNKLWETNGLEDAITQLTDNFVNNEEENEMKNTNDAAGNNELWEENEMNENIDIKELVSMGADPEEVKALVDLLNEIDQEILINKRKSQKVLKMISGETTKTTVNEEELTMEELNKIRSKNEQAVASEFAMMLKSFEESITLAQQRQVEDEQILKTKSDIDNYFMPVDAKDNYEEENEMDKNKNAVGNFGLWEEITVEKEHSETEEITKETVVEETAEAKIKGGGFDATSLIDKVAGFKEVTAEKVSVLKEAASEKVSQAKATIENVDEDNEYYQKGVEVTEKAKNKYNKVLGNVFNRLKL